ncbi:polyamine ABC transporter substrate-binding protein [Vogesella sp. LIG4]|uniref:polyamine ABC transporter substrate-binding protein n=1 Tax=Vogesella sp. LIG4 TaxID=1192162 RepID=UPI0008200D33|nr:polyamine ABC transporter substrate-binding protein [Vogesella sp. LIG4]SCK29440.1 putrescine transport system substrate-binding protein [Vogesella sp. LIG4]
MRTPTIIAASLLLAAATSSQAETLNIYNWSDYIGPNTVKNFETQSGIKIKYDVYDSDDTLQGKLLTGKAGYDIVVPTSNYLGRQAAAGIYLKLDRSKIPNWNNLDKTLMKLVESADPGNKYGVPYAWFTDGLGYNVNKVNAALGANAPLDSWDIMFKPEYLSKLKSCGVSVLDSPTDVFAATLHYLGKNPNSTNPADYQAAFQTLKTIRPHITQFNSSGYINDLANADVCFAFGWSGDINIAKRRAAEAGKSYKIQYVIPKSGAPLSVDLMAIPKDAPNPEAAHKWMNYILSPQVGADITNKVFYPTATVPARSYMLPMIANDSTIFPPESVMKTLFLLKPLPPEILRLENRLWVQLKTGH